jgi:hypothetical protein
MKKNRKSAAIATVLFVFIFLLSQCINTPAKPDPRGTAFAPEQSCRQCHQAVYDSAVNSAHYLASAAATAKNVLGNFNVGHNSFVYDSITRVMMEQRDSGLYQVLYKNNQETEARRFDIVFGMRHAQTALYWLNDRTFELPVSYYRVVNNWGTSPGFSATVPNFSRLIGMDCFECHSSYISHKKNSAASGNYFASDEAVEVLEKNSLVAGIDCQRCHGPAAEHVNFHEQNPHIKTPGFLVSNKTLNRQQQLDQCAVCHSGNDKRKIQSRFMFRPGDMLASYFLPAVVADSTHHFDVHGNQLNLLKQSACFLQSNMTCSTCHDPHGNANLPVAVYSQKCMGCHTEAANNFCTLSPAPGIVLNDNCIDCHMPKEASAAISFQLSGNAVSSSYLLRSHRIAVYKEMVKK